MKKFFYILVTIICLTTSSNAQTPEEKTKTFVATVFPSYMPEYVFANTEVVPVDHLYAKKHKDLYWHTDLNKKIYQSGLRIGDTVLVFNGQPYFSKGQQIFMSVVVKEKFAKVKKQKAPKQPKSEEQKANEMQVLGNILQTGAGILTRRTGGNGTYSGTNPTIRQ